MSGGQSMMSLFDQDPASFIEELEGPAAPQAVPISDANAPYGAPSIQMAPQQQSNVASNPFSDYDQFSNNSGTPGGPDPGQTPGGAPDSVPSNMMSPTHQQSTQYGSPTSSTNMPNAQSNYNYSQNAQQDNMQPGNATWNQNAQGNTLQHNMNKSFQPGMTSNQQGGIPRQNYPGQQPFAHSMTPGQQQPQMGQRYPGYPGQQMNYSVPTTGAAQRLAQLSASSPGGTIINRGQMRGVPQTMPGQGQFPQNNPMVTNYNQQLGNKMAPFSSYNPMPNEQQQAVNNIITPNNIQNNSTGQFNQNQGNTGQAGFNNMVGQPSSNQQMNAQGNFAQSNSNPQQGMPQNMPQGMHQAMPPQMASHGNFNGMQGPMTAMDRDIQQLQQQISQLYNMPQTTQSQQQMLDLQEKMRTLKAQQQQFIMQQQRQQQQMTPQRPNNASTPQSLPSPHTPGTPKPSTPQPTPVSSANSQTQNVSTVSDSEVPSSTSTSQISETTLTSQSGQITEPGQPNQSNQSMQVEQSTMQGSQQPMQLPMQTGQQALQPGQQTLQPGQQHMQPMQPGQQPMQPGQQPMQPGQQPMQPGQQPMQPGQQPMQVGMQPGQIQGQQPGQMQGQQPGQMQGQQPGQLPMQPGQQQMMGQQSMQQMQPGQGMPRQLMQVGQPLRPGQVIHSAQMISQPGMPPRMQQVQIIRVSNASSMPGQMTLQQINGTQGGSQMYTVQGQQVVSGPNGNVMNRPVMMQPRMGPQTIIRGPQGVIIQQGQPMAPQQGPQPTMIMNQQMGIQGQRIMVQQNNQQGSGVMMQPQQGMGPGMHHSGSIGQNMQPGGNDVDGVTEDGAKGQEKANQIVQDAIARAQAQGLPVPKIVTPADLDPNKKSRGRKKPAGDGSTKKRGGRSKKAKIEVKVENPTLAPSPAVEENVLTPGPPATAEESSQDAADKDVNEDGEGDVGKTEKKGKTPARKRTVPQMKKRKLPPATFIKSKKKKRRLGDDSDMSDDGDIQVHHDIRSSSPAPGTPDEKRRSTRNTKRKQYKDDIDLNLSEDEKPEEDHPEGIAEIRNDVLIEEHICEKILGTRMKKREIVTEHVTTEEKENEDGEMEEVEKKTETTETVEVEEFYVKFKNYSYLHCEWKTADEHELTDKRIHQKIKRYKAKRQSAIDNYLNEADEDEYFNPDYTEVDRVLAESIAPADPDIEGSIEYKHYLVKWCALPYEDSTWELQADVNAAKIEAFKKFTEPPEDMERNEIARPHVKDWKKLEDIKEYKNNNKLREYQLEGVNWLTFCYYNQQNSILADEMGLGKTVQSITYLQEVYNAGVEGPYLIIVPLSTLGNWQREFETWTDLNVIVYHGSTPSRNMIQEYEMYYRDKDNEKIPNIYRFHALITTYEMIITDFELLAGIDWRVCIIDEAHRLKNKKCKLMEGLDYFELEHRVLLTGTPLQNNVEELYSLLNFLEPKQFASQEAFMNDFGNLKSEGQVDKLKALLKPMMLRRLKEDVEKSLAPKEETIVEVELTNVQKKFYRAILERNFAFLSKGATSNSNVPNLMNTMMELRKCCNHPYLINGAEEQILSEQQGTVSVEPEKLLSTMVQSSGKLVLVDKLLPKLKAGNHKVLIFSQMIRVLDIIEDYLLQKKYLYERLDGRIRGTTRQEAIDRFSKPDSDRFAFLLCTRAGGLGINLTAADTVIIYDSDWNPQNDLQAQARCHRIGQEKSVKIYRLITRNTYEREMFDKASLKLGLDKAVLQNINAGKEKTDGSAAAANTGLSKKEVEDLLKRGAYGSLMEDEEGGDDFCEEDIDQILQRRTQVITLEAGEKGSTFAKASFSTSATRSDIDLDDPDFWEKWAKKADVDVEEATGKNKKSKDLIMELPRRRKQTSRYGGDTFKEESSESSDSDDDSNLSSSTITDTKSSKKKKRGRGRNVKNRDGDEDTDDYSESESTASMYNRADLFKFEKLILVWGYGRWKDILANGTFKCRMKPKHVETLARAMLMYSVLQYHGDDKIKSFILDLVRPAKEGEERITRNHKGLSTPVPRGRKGKNKSKHEESRSLIEKEISEMDLDPEKILRDKGYRKHLVRHCNKILLRVRMLYYISQEVIGDNAKEILKGCSHKDVDLPLPRVDIELPIPWWDDVADKSLLMAVFKHGYEKYHTMRADSSLVFLQTCGPPSKLDLAKEQDDVEGINDEDDLKDDASETSQKNCDTADSDNDGSKLLPFPTVTDLNTRLRKLMAGYQHNHKREIINQEMMSRMNDRKIDVQQTRWIRREESDFYRVISTFGIERDPKTEEINWTTFRSLANLTRKYDETLTEYYKAFYHMCMRVCKRFKTEEEALAPNGVYVEAITKERAERCLSRIDLLSKIREEILWHPRLEERIRLCQPSVDLPSWWQCGVHDKELLIGAAKHGISRTDYHILYDPKLIFREVVQKYKGAEAAEPPSITRKYTRNSVRYNKGLTNGDINMDSEEKSEDAPEKKHAHMNGELSQTDEDEPPIVVVKTEEMNGDLSTDEMINGENDSTCTEPSENVTGVKDEMKEETKEEKMVENGEKKNEVKQENDDEIAGEMKKEEAKDDTSKQYGDDLVKSEVKTEQVEKDLVKCEFCRSKDAKDSDTIDEDDKCEDSADGMKCVCKELNMAKDEVKREEKDEENKGEMKDDVISQSSQDEDEHHRSTSERMLQSDGMDLNDPNVQEYIKKIGADNNDGLTWPKDRIIIHRLEHISLTVETGEWPAVTRPLNYLNKDNLSDSRSSTPIPPGTPSECGTPLHSYDYGSSGTPDPMNESMRMAMFKRRRHRRTKAEVEAEKAEKSVRMREMLAASLGVGEDGEPNLAEVHRLALESGYAAGMGSSLGTSPAKSENSPLKREEDYSIEQQVQMFMPQKKRRGRKRKIDKLLEAAQAVAAEKMAQAQLAAVESAMAKQSTDVHIPVINLEDGSRISGEDAPLASELEAWLDDHPGFIAERDMQKEDVMILAQRQAELMHQQQQLMAHHAMLAARETAVREAAALEEAAQHSPGMSKDSRSSTPTDRLTPSSHSDRLTSHSADMSRSAHSPALSDSQKKRSRLDPSKIDMDAVTGDENVTVFNRETGKKVSGSKAPTLKNLPEWLKRNPGYDVDPRWVALVKAKGNLPHSLKIRLQASGGMSKPGSGSKSTPSSSTSPKPSRSSSSSASTSSANPYADAAGIPPGMTASEYQQYIASMAAYSSMSGAMGMAAYGGLGGLAGMGMNPMYLASLGMLPGMHGDTEADDGDKKKDSKSMEEAMSSAQQAALAQYMYNPMIMQQMLAAQTMGLSAGLPANYASLMNAQVAAAAGLTNGTMEEAENSGKSKKHSERDRKEHRERHRDGHRDREHSRDHSDRHREREHSDRHREREHSDRHREREHSDRHGDKYREHHSEHRLKERHHERHKESHVSHKEHHKEHHKDLNHDDRTAHKYRNDDEHLMNSVQDLSAHRSPPVRKSSVDCLDGDDQGLDLSVGSKKSDITT